jgi:hypothetical protein
MIKISSAITDIIKNQPFLLFGFRNGLFNLSQLARFLKPLIQVRTKKDVTETSVLMSLSRMSKNLRQAGEQKIPFFIKNLTVNSNLCTVTYVRSENAIKRINKFYSETHKKNHYFNLNQGTMELTLIIEENFLPLLKKYLKEKPKMVKRNLSSIGIHFEEKYYETPGFMHYVIQQISLQNINIYEYTSTYTELIFYIDQKDIQLAFETLNILLNDH